MLMSQVKRNPSVVIVGAGGYLACTTGLHSLQTQLPAKAKVKPTSQFLIYPIVDMQGLTGLLPKI
jgi:hypothetical protein